MRTGCEAAEHVDVLPATSSLSRHLRFAKEFRMAYGMNKVFLSYSRKDEAKARELKQLFEYLGYSVWLDTEDIGGGDLWRSEIVKGIENCQLYAVALTTHSINSEAVRREMDLARTKHKPILPIYTEPKPLKITREMEYQLVGLHIVQYEEMFDARVGAVLDNLTRIPETRIMPASQLGAEAYLQHENGMVIPLNRTGQVVGRGSAADIDVTPWDRNRFVSKRHAELAYRDGKWQLSVCDEAQNPTLVDGKVVSQKAFVALKDGDCLTFADVEFRFLISRRD